MKRLKRRSVVFSGILAVIVMVCLLGPEWFQKVYKDVTHQQQVASHVQLADEYAGLRSDLVVAEKALNEQRYMDLISRLVAKQKQIDAVWDSATSAKVQTALDEGVVEDFFSRDQKLSMLAAKHNLSPDLIQQLKSEIEVMFEYEYVEKYAHS